MSTIKFQVPNVTIVGDGVSTSISLSYKEYPFPANPPGTIVDAVFVSNDANLASLEVTSRFLIVHFTAPFTGNASLAFFAFYQP